MTDSIKIDYLPPITLTADELHMIGKGQPRKWLTVEEIETRFPRIVVTSKRDH